MKAETVFNVAIHLSDHELERLNYLIANELNLRTENLLKIDTISRNKRLIRLIETCFSKVKD